jgi:membrane-associated phospholipid phosphatase
MIALLRKNGPFFGPYLLFLLAGGLLQWRYSQADIFLFVNTHYHAWADLLFAYGTHLGDGLFYAAVVLLLLFVRYQYALTALAAFLLSGLTAQLLKRLAFSGALRPKAFFDKSGQVLHWVDGVEVHLHNSFPSGHATTAFSVFCLLSLLAGRKGWGGFWFALALGAAYSRVYLGQHFFGDIFAGSLIGVGATVACYLLLNRVRARYPRRWYDGNLRRRRLAEGASA